ncbi:DUF4012 domain-containing protein [Agromyces aurantiacus]|uniref:DUF4012 domain-containing protein n=1 Tax=Agromyces aurantiacus TaxID=165814 RepID=A0ABV9R7P1_9MICO|nr:DUF4012 domain-containing protein [Agromyces aurantiacus]MBM7504003.1 hypothetical protein [Agromyces aurantiacus]
MTTPEFVLAPERQHRSSSGRSRKRRRRRIFHAIFWPVLALIIIGGGLSAWWLGTSALQVRDDLEAARASVAKFQSLAAERKVDELQPVADELAASASSAVAPTGNPIWRVAEWVPGLGENFRAVRIIAEGVDDISTEVVQPTVGLVGSFGIARDDSGALDLGPLREATEVAQSADRVLGRLGDSLASVDRDATIGQVSDAVGELEGVVASAQQTVPGLNAALAGAGAMLGIDGPQTVLLAFGNNAEAMPLGGGPAAQTLLSVDDGTITIDRQLSSTQLDTQAPIDVKVDDSAFQLYNDILLTEINATTSRPDFPTAAELLRARWQRDVGITPDTVVMTDPIGVSRILKVTGPVTLPNGEQLTSDNVVSKMLNEIYFTYPEGGAESDAFFASASAAVFDRLMSGDYDVWAMAQALIDVTNGGSLMMWTSDEPTQALFAGSRLDGTLPATNDGATVLGVYFRDRSISKIDYYLHTEATVTTDTCTPDAPTYTVEARLRFDIPEGLELPEYIESRFTPGTYRTEVFLYGPVGGTTTAVEVPEPGLGTTTGPSVVDLNRPAEKFTVDLQNGGTALVRATFAGTPDDGPVAVRTTPMINPTGVKVVEAPCG